MGELIDIVDSLENKISKLLHKLEVLQRSNQQLEEALKEATSKSELAQGSIEVWQEKYNSLKMASTMLGSNQDKKEAKLKINTLIRELDSCIAQLAE
ncbi:Hypothetical protein I595_2196 [Croceitalea dokdonensis DOKDO 023]|uniref:Mis12-Mtw1 protein family n=1 Tax=Croceitalea dokdonensis DOKDO 023 TaxID=1300341 RepID=A0A0P7AYY8_9FLAO|nr:hypothetical protein [Croceitalea dokdonensis]KPM31701.1 Hypothetical protein I595_2196 [Croceitalea dokdonensis DOKDO 023]